MEDDIVKRVLGQVLLKLDTLQDEQIQASLWLQKGGRYPDAIRGLQGLLQSVGDPELLGELRYYLAESHELAGDADRALVEYLKVTYLPTQGAWSLTSRFRAGKIYEDQMRFQDAIRLYQGLADASPESQQGQFAARKVRELSKSDAETVMP